MRTAVPSATNCAGCGAGLLQTWLPEVTDPQTGEQFAVVHCTRCGLKQTSPRPDDLARYYGPAYHGGRHGVTARWCAHRRLRWIASLAGPGEGRRLLDLGCGDGTFLLAAAGAGWQVAGTELNPEPARRNGLDVRKSLDEAADGAPYDCITSWHSLEHMHDPAAVLAQVRRMLAPDGLLAVAVPDAGGLPARIFGRHWLHLDVPRHLYHFDRQALSGLLGQAGFTIVATRHQEFEYDLLGWAQSGLNAVTPIPNVFFLMLAGRPVTAGGGWRCINLLLGIFFSVMALPWMFIATGLRRGGTLVVLVKKH